MRSTLSDRWTGLDELEDGGGCVCDLVPHPEPRPMSQYYLHKLVDRISSCKIDTKDGRKLYKKESVSG